MSKLRLPLALALTLAASAAHAQNNPVARAVASRPSAPAPEPEEVTAPDSPRASMARFLDHARHRRWPDAARYLELPRDQESDGPQRARELLEVLDRHMWLEPSALSGDAQGDTSDGLPTRVDEVGRVPGLNGAPEPVRITRREYEDGPRWVFTRQTTARVSQWYSRLEGRWLRERLPVWSLRLGPRDLLLWQWAALPLVLVAALALARVLASLTVRALERVTRRAWPALSESIPTRAKGPITGLWVVPLGAGGAALLGLYPPAQSFVDGVFRAMLFTAVFWGIWRSVGLLTQTVLESAWARAHPSSETLVPLGSRALKVVVVALAVTAVLSSLGYPVASLVAGLGIGGLAFALAAQKTGEHLFGSVAIGLDQPFRVGDFVKVEDHSGTVESLGLRSTRMRTQDRTVVTIPNGKLADLRVENFSQRDRYHFNPKLHVAPDGDPAAMGALVEALRALLTAHPQRVDSEDLLVFVREINGDAVVVEAQCWFTADDWNAWLPVRTALLLKALAAVQAQGLRLVAPPRPPPPPPKA